MIEHGGLKPCEVSFFTQRDGYGDAGFLGGIEALKRNGLQRENDVAHGRYERNTVAVEHGLAEVLLHRNAPKAIIMVGAYAPCARFIQLARSMEYEGIFLNVSFVGSNSLAKALGEEVEGVIVTQVVPHPESNSQLAEDYRQALNAWDANKKLDHGSFEGYIAARILALAFSRIASRVTRETSIQSLETLGEFNIGFDQTLILSATEHQASHSVWPTILRGGAFVPFNWKQLEQMQ